ncbi:putative disease resistance protein RGA1 [Triticum urartu]|nr:putative disease resistance protein RGA1 [Triticum urartu]
MEIFISALMGELISRSVSSIINKYSKPPAEAVEAGLERILLRGQVIIDEAMGRHITNHGMLQQLSMLRYAMYQGYYVLDTFRCQAHKEEENNLAVSQSGVVSNFRYAQRLCLSRSNNKRTAQGLEEALDSLRSMILDASEMVRFLTTYPRLHRQPYSMHLLLGKCMFARQRETELVMDFLLCTQPSTGSLGGFDVLPIVGPDSVGKSTLVAHVCEDERVRDCFSQIVSFRHDSFRVQDIAALGGTCALRHENNGRLLIVVDIVGDLYEDLWEILCSLCRQSTISGSKIIITSRSDKITKLGTTQTLVLKHLSHEAYWYFFKVITFGSTDPEMHPRLVYLAMEIAELLNGNLIEANVAACVLRANFDIKFWCKVLAFRRAYLQNQLCKFGEHPCEPVKENRPMYLQRLGRATEDVLVHGINQTCCSEEELPNITNVDVWYGNTRPQGIFKALAWKSRIPPYHCYIQTCEIRELQARAVKRKRPLMNASIRHV